MDDFGSYGVVIAHETEPGHLVPFGRRDEGLCCQQVRLSRKAESLRERKLETGAIIERITGGGSKTRVPHQPGKESGIDDHRRATHVARTEAMWSHHLVAVNANSDGLSIA